MKTQMEIFGGTCTARSFEHDAMGFLLAYAKRHKGRAFSAEDVTLAAVDAGLSPMDLRSWGTVFAQAARDGFIRRSDVLFRRVMGNGTLSPGWVGV